MALQGTLDSFSLPDVMRLLATTGKTGRLHVDGDRGQGNVWLNNGTVVAGNADRALDDAPIDEVVFEMLRFNTGSFAFAADEQSPDGNEPSEVEGVLARAGSLLDEWRELESVVPSLEHRVGLARTLTVDKVTLDGSRWQAIAAIGGGRSVGELGDALGLGELGVTRTVSDLVELGVIVLESPERTRRASLSGRRSRSDRTDRTDRPATDERRVFPSQPDDVGGNGPRQESSFPGERPETPAPYGARSSGEIPGSIEDTNGRSSGEGPALPRRSRSTGERSEPENGSIPRRRRAGADLSALPSFDDAEPRQAPLLPPSLDTSPPGSAPLPDDTGQVPVVPAPSLPPDLSWAAEDDQPPLPPAMASPPVGTPPVAPPLPEMARAAERRMDAADRRVGGRGIATAQQPTSGPHREGDTAAHVAVLSTNARAAVEATVGPSGGGMGLAASRHTQTPDEAHQRGMLMGFLSSLRR